MRCRWKRSVGLLSRSGAGPCRTEPCQSRRPARTRWSQTSRLARQALRGGSTANVPGKGQGKAPQGALRSWASLADTRRSVRRCGPRKQQQPSPGWRQVKGRPLVPVGLAGDFRRPLRWILDASLKRPGYRPCFLCQHCQNAVVA